MRSSSEYRRIAREALKGRYFQMVGIALIAAILGGGIRITDCCSSLGLIGFLIGGYASLCLLQIYRNILDTKELDLKDLLSFTDSFLSALLLRVLCVLFICLWSLLLIIPGIIKKYSYSMSGYIMSVNPDIDPMDAISMSSELYLA